VTSVPPAETVPSPCINVCRMDDATGWCHGCQRTLPEIAAWSGLSADAKRAVWRQLQSRRDTVSSRPPAVPDGAAQAQVPRRAKADPA
jgi:predicted Fe-S protein YdhL (DUF1289 family)